MPTLYIVLYWIGLVAGMIIVPPLFIIARNIAIRKSNVDDLMRPILSSQRNVKTAYIFWWVLAIVVGVFRAAMFQGERLMHDYDRSNNANPRFRDGTAGDNRCW